MDNALLVATSLHFCFKQLLSCVSLQEKYRISPVTIQYVKMEILKILASIYVEKFLALLMVNESSSFTFTLKFTMSSLIHNYYKCKLS